MNQKSGSSGDSLKAIRKAQGYSQQSLGDAIGVTQKTVSAWESGKQGVDEDNMLKLAEELEVTLPTLRSALGLNEVEFDREWLASVMRDQELSTITKAIISTVPLFWDEEHQLAAFHLEDIADALKDLTLEDIEGHWDDVLNSGHVERVKKVRWLLKPKRKHR
jgi:transcriptional regulator with XRE-family HTH domain